MTSQMVTHSSWLAVVPAAAPAQGSDFGKLLSRELLYSFTLTYSIELNQGSLAGGRGGAGSSAGGGGAGVFAMDHYAEFQSKIAHIIRNAVKPLLDQCKRERERRAQQSRAKATDERSPYMPVPVTAFPSRIPSTVCVCTSAIVVWLVLFSARAARYCSRPPLLQLF